jgi:hypothetical protein
MPATVISRTAGWPLIFRRSDYPALNIVIPGLEWKVNRRRFRSMREDSIRSHVKKLEKAFCIATVAQVPQSA